MAVEKLNTSIHMDFIKKLDADGLLKRNYDRPPIKDTVTVPVGGYTIIRFLADNPGTWMFHCHLDFHSEVGMSLLVKVGQKKDLPPEPINWPKCGNYFYKEKDLIRGPREEDDYLQLIGVASSVKCFSEFQLFSAVVVLLNFV